MSMYSDTNREIGDGQRGQDQHYEYPKALYKGQDMALADDLNGELALIESGYSTGEVEKPNPMAEEVIRLRAELAAAKGEDAPRRGPGRPPRQVSEIE